MKVLALEYEPSSTRGGQEHSLFEVCAGLARDGVDVTLGYNLPGDLIERYHAAGVRTVALPAYTLDRRVPVRSAARLAQGFLRALRLEFDVVYLNQYLDVLFGGALARAKRVPLVCHLRLFPPEAFCGQWRLGLPAVSRFIAVSDATRDAYAQRGFAPESLVRVYNGVDVDRFRPLPVRERVRAELGIPQDAFVVMYGGRIDPPKNIEDLLRAFALLELPPERARLLVVGGPVVHADATAGQSYERRLRELAASLGIASSVHWLGRRRDMPELFNAADLTASFSLLPETFGRTIAESLSCGTPSIAADLGGVPEVLTGEFARFRFESGDLRRAVALMRAHRHWRTTDPDLARRARAFVARNFNARRMAAEVGLVLSETVGEGVVRRDPRPTQLRPPAPEPRPRRESSVAVGV